MTTRVLVLGGGYAGLSFINTLLAQRVPDVRITLVDRNPYHTMLTECHLVAAGSKPAQAVQLPYDLLAGFDRVQTTVESIDPEARMVHTAHGVLAYDVLVLGLGSVDNDFGIPGVREHARSLRSVAEAKAICRQVDDLAEGATVAIAGGGLTGVELAAELALHHADRLRFFILEAAPTVLPGQPDELRAWTRQRLGELGVNCLIGSPITHVDERLIHLKNGSTVAYDLLIWSGGVKANPLVGQLGVATDRGGRAIVDKHLMAGRPDVYVIGDCASAGTPPTAQAGIQHGALAAQHLAERLQKGSSTAAFAYRDQGVLVDVGGSFAVGRLGSSTKLSGRIPLVAKRFSELRWAFKAGGMKAVAYRLRHDRQGQIHYGEAGD